MPINKPRGCLFIFLGSSGGVLLFEWGVHSRVAFNIYFFQNVNNILQNFVYLLEISIQKYIFYKKQAYKNRMAQISKNKNKLRIWPASGFEN